MKEGKDIMGITFEEMLEQHKDIPMSMETYEEEIMTEDDGTGWMEFEVK